MVTFYVVVHYTLLLVVFELNIEVTCRDSGQPCTDEVFFHLEHNS